MQGSEGFWKKHKKKILAGVVGAGVLGAGAYVYANRHSFAPETDYNTAVHEPSSYKSTLFETLGIFDSVSVHGSNTRGYEYGVSFPNNLGIKDSISIDSHRNIYLTENLGFQDSYSSEAA